MRALDRLRQMAVSPAGGSKVSFVSATSYVDQSQNGGFSRGACLSEQPTNYLKNNETQVSATLDYLEPRTDKTDFTSPWPEPPLPDDDEHARWLRGEISFAAAYCTRCDKALGGHALVHIGHGQLLHKACGRWVRRQ